MQKINTHLLTYLLRKTTSRVCPPNTSDEIADSKKRNCFYPWVLKGEERDFVVLKVVGSEAHGLRYLQDRSSEKVCVPVSTISPDSLEITHIYGNYRLTYIGVWSAIWRLSSGWSYLYIHTRLAWDITAQWVFNRRPLPARRRLELLREVIDLAETTSDEVTSILLMSARHGDRWAVHPEWWSHHARLDEQLKLLTEMGDLQDWNRGYRPTGQGLRTLDDADEADRKHRENVRVQWSLVLLAVASLLMAAVQAGIVKFPTLLDLTSNQTTSTSSTPSQSNDMQDTTCRQHTSSIK